jgi:hypothetical protein
VSFGWVEGEVCFVKGRRMRKKKKRKEKKGGGGGYK